MTPRYQTNPTRPAGRSVSRRGFLGLAGGGLLAGAAAAGGFGAVDRLLAVSAGQDADYRPAAAAVDTGLILVTIQLEGGLDFLDTVIPLNDPAYGQLRRSSGVDLGSAIPIDRDFAFHPSLPYLAERWGGGELAIVHGVGYPDSSLSHFVDTAIWERGTEDQAEATGWIGRSLDAYAGEDADPLLGISIGTLTPAMYGPDWNPVSLSEEGQLPWTGSFIEENPDLVRAYARLAAAPSMPNGDLADRVRAGQTLVREVADTIGGATDLEALGRTFELLEEGEAEADAVDDEASNAGAGVLAHRLGVVADLIAGGLPTRAYHVAHGGDFDTHGEQAYSLPGLLRSLDEGLRAFDQRLGPLRSRVVVATWTEFGRRPDWNGSGTDHGTAGTQFVLGPRVAGGHHGDPVSLTRFDFDDNFFVTGDYRRYLAGLAQGVLGVDGTRILGPGVTPMGVIV
ncbi:MAG: DUF1501 domain-containing protein [Actinomycetota bacterium]